MNRLGRRIAALIDANGPLSVAEYMRLCLLDPLDGYYTTREPFGAGGDFITAPEVSQMFGELVGLWMRLAWDAAGRPVPVTLAEIGPGRGTMMRDILRTLRQSAPSLVESASIGLIEASPRLAAVQRSTLGDDSARVAWHRDVEALPDQPLILVGNELFDAIPIRQMIKTGGRWHERVVGVDEGGKLSFGIGPPTGYIPAATAAEGTVIEVAPEREALMRRIAHRLVRSGVAALLIDYGHLRPGTGDTLQAVRRHAVADVLLNPGEADLTAHVDFAVLARVAADEGLSSAATTQGEFLLRMGLLERAGRLGSGLATTEQDAIHAAVERLAGSDQMGDLFKVMCVQPGSTLLPPFAAGDRLRIATS